MEILIERAASARDCYWKSALRRQDQLSTPASNYCVSNARHIVSVWLTFAHGQLPDSTGVEDVGHVVATIAVIASQAKARQCWSAVELVLRETENVLEIILADRPRVVDQSAQPV